MNKRIRELRKSLDMTQTDFAQAIGLTQNTITLIETGKRNISDFSVRNICREFHVKEEWLRFGTGEMFETSLQSELDALTRRYNLSPGSRILVEKFVTLKPAQQDAVLKFIRDTAASLTDDR